MYLDINIKIITFLYAFRYNFDNSFPLGSPAFQGQSIAI